MPEELPDNSEESKEEVDTTLSVKVTNQVKETKWNDSKDDSEYDELDITEEDMNI